MNWFILHGVIVYEDDEGNRTLHDNDALRDYYKQCRQRYATFTLTQLHREKLRLYKSLKRDRNWESPYDRRALNALKNELKVRNELNS